MRSLVFSLAFTSLAGLALAQAPDLADPISWGSAVSGMRVGVALAQGSAGRELRGVFANMAPTQQSLVIATQGRGFGYSFSMRAQGGPDGKEHEISSWVDAR